MRYILYAILLATAVPLYAQEIRLDSLWIKMGGYPTMAFSPDSKTLLLGQADGIVNIVNVQSGIPLDSIILPKNGYADFAFSPDGKYLIVSERKKITFYSALTWDSVGEIRDIETVGFLSFSNDGAYVAVADWYSTISVVDLIHRKQIYLIKRPDEYKGSNNQNLPYFNGKVYFSEDGTRLYGKNANDFGFWDLTKKDTPFSRAFTIGNRAVIGFTPDRKYMIQQSNYIWDLNTKSQIQIQGKKDFNRDYAVGFTSTISSQIIVTLKEDPEPLTLHIPLFIDIGKKRIITTNPIRYYTTQMLLSSDSNYLVRQLGTGSVLLNKVQWPATTIQDEIYTNPSISISPIPGKESLQLHIQLRQASLSFDVRIHDAAGRHIENVYSGSVEPGEQLYSINTKNYSSGSYYVMVSHNGHTSSYPFIINK